jgi:hypothetical protein
VRPATAGVRGQDVARGELATGRCARATKSTMSLFLSEDRHYLPPQRQPERLNPHRSRPLHLTAVPVYAPKLRNAPPHERNHPDDPNRHLSERT